MSFRSSSSFHSGQRDERRRRLLTDELANPDDWPSSPHASNNEPPASKSDRYGDARFLQEQPRLLDLIPRGMMRVALVLATTMATLASLVAVYGWRLNAGNGTTVITALNIGAKGSLGCWLSSLLLLATTFMTILIYRVRRHRTDDYQGRYRIWLWAALFGFLLATDQAASLREGFRDMMTALTGTTLWGNGDLWWAALFGFALGAIGSRLVVEMLPCRMAVSAFVGAAVMLSLAAIVRLDWMLPPIGNNVTLFIACSEMLAYWLLFAATLFFARHVVRDAQGLLPKKQSDEDEPGPAAEIPVRIPASNHAWQKIDPPHPTPQPVFAKPTPTPAVAAVVPSPINRKLTKAEKKALKERLLRERQERQARGY